MDQTLYELESHTKNVSTLEQKLLKQHINDPFGQTIFLEASEIGLNLPHSTVRIDISPNREMISQYLTTNNKLGSTTAEIYKGLINNPNFLRTISIDILNENHTEVVGICELHLLKEGNKIIAVDPLHPTRLPFNMESEHLIHLSNPKSKAESVRLPKVSPSNLFTTDSFLVDQEFQGQGIGAILFQTGNLVAKLMGANERVVWSSTEEASRFYCQKGAQLEPVTLAGLTKQVPIVHLK